MTDRRLAVEAWESLFRAQHEVFAEISVDFAGAGLIQEEYDVLLTVARAPDMTARLRDVTKNMLVSQPSVSRLVDRMVARGLITKVPDPYDGRGSLVRATDAGASAFRAIATVHAATIAERMAILTDDELQQLLELTAKLRRRVEDETQSTDADSTDVDSTDVDGTPVDRADAAAGASPVSA